MRTFTSKKHKLIADIFLLCDDLNISDQVKANIEYAKNNILEKEQYISALMNYILLRSILIIQQKFCFGRNLKID